MPSKFTQVELVQRIKLIDITQTFALHHYSSSAFIVHSILSAPVERDGYGLSEQEIRLYYVFLRVYFADKNRKILDFSSQDHLKTRLAEEIRVLQREKKTLDRERKIENRRVVSGEKKFEKGWLPLGKDHLEELIQGLIQSKNSNYYKKGIIEKAPHKREKKLFPRLFSGSNDEAFFGRRTHKTKTYQPAIDHEEFDNLNFLRVPAGEGAYLMKIVGIENSNRRDPIRIFEWIMDALEVYFFGVSEFGLRKRYDDIAEAYINPKYSWKELQDNTKKIIDDFYIIDELMILKDEEAIKKKLLMEKRWRNSKRGNKPVSKHRDTYDIMQAHEDYRKEVGEKNTLEE